MRLVVVALFALFSAPALAQPFDHPTTAGVLVLGDSNSEGPFGGDLYNSLRAMRDPVSGQQINAYIFAKCGAGANDWVVREYANIDCGAWRCGEGRSISDCRHFMGGDIPPLPALYGKLNSERRVTIVVLGLNMIIGNRAHKLRDAVNLIAAIKDQNSACIWVGPPQPGDLFVAPSVYEDFVGDLKETVVENGCRYISSDDKTDRRNLGEHTRNDHYSRDDAIAWADKVVDELQHPRHRGDRSLTDLLKGQDASVSAKSDGE